MAFTSHRASSSSSSLQLGSWAGELAAATRIIKGGACRTTLETMDTMSTDCGSHLPPWEGCTVHPKLGVGNGGRNDSEGQIGLGIVRVESLCTKRIPTS